MGWNNQLVSLLVVEASGGYTGVFIYDPVPGPGNLASSDASQAGTDPYGNAYPAGLYGQQLTLQDGPPAPAFAGASVLYSDANGRLYYVNAAGVSAVVDRSNVNVAVFGVPNTATPTTIGAPLAYMAGESNQSSSYEIEIRGNGTWATAGFNPPTFWLYLDGAPIGGSSGFQIDDTWASSAGGFSYTVSWLVSFLSTGPAATIVTSVHASFSRTGLAVVPTVAVTANGVNSGTPCNSIINHTFQPYANWGAVSTGQIMNTYQTRITRYN